MRIPDPPPNEKPLVGWQEIADYLDVKLSSVHRFKSRRRLPLPYHKIGAHPYAYPSELQVWLRQQAIPGQVDPGDSGEAGSCHGSRMHIRETTNEETAEFLE